MLRTLSSYRRFLFAGAIAGVLSFGATQAFATPPAAAGNYCDQGSCDFWCYYNTGTHGWCDGYNCWCGF